MNADPSTTLRFARDDNIMMSKIQTRLILTTLFLLPVYLIKIRFGWVSFNALEILISVLFFGWLFEKNKKHVMPYAKYFIPALLILTGLLLSVFANKNFYIGLGAIKGWFLFPIIFAIIFYNQLKKDDGLLKKSLAALFYSGFAISLFGIIYKFLGIMTFDGRLKIFWDSPNQLAMFLAIPFLIGAARFVSRFDLGKSRTFSKVREEKVEPWKKLTIILGLALIAINLYFTQSFGAWLAIAVSLVIYFWLKYSKILQKKHIAAFLIFFLIFISWAGFSKFENIKNLGDRSSLASRAMIWKSAGLMIKNNPLFGIGPGNFQEKYLEYQKYFPPYLEWSAPQPHNIFLAFWLESGLIGLAGFILLLIYFFSDNKKTIRNDRKAGILFLAIMIYILIHGLVDTTYWRNDLAVVFWVMIAGNYYLREKSAECIQLEDKQ